MIFRFLRQYLRDEEFERTKTQLAESKALLAEYKETIQKENSDKQDESKRVDIDFLVLLWATVGFGFAIFIEAAKKLIELQPKHQSIFYFWVGLVIFTVIYVTYNSLFALELTNTYAKTKSNSGYIMFARLSIAGAILITAVVLTTAILGK